MTTTTRERLKQILLKLESGYDQGTIDDGGIYGGDKCLLSLEQEIKEAKET